MGPSGSVSSERIPAARIESIFSVSSSRRELNHSANSRCSSAGSFSIATAISVTVLMPRTCATKARTARPAERVNATTAGQILNVQSTDEHWQSSRNFMHRVNRPVKNLHPPTEKSSFLSVTSRTRSRCGRCSSACASDSGARCALQPRGVNAPAMPFEDLPIE